MPRLRWFVRNSRTGYAGPSSSAARSSPPSRLRRYGAASFACQTLAWFTEPKLAEGERRMVDQTRASWNRIARWLGRMEALRVAA
jgi:hypothetical protein